MTTRHPKLPPIFPAEREWMFDGNCLNTTVNMHPEDAHGVAVAQAVCLPLNGEPCRVLDVCATYALEHGEKFGVWGGLSMRDRTRIWKRRRRAVAA